MECFFFGETCWSVHTRLNKHDRCYQLWQFNLSAVREYAIVTDRRIDLKETCAGQGKDIL